MTVALSRSRAFAATALFPLGDHRVALSYANLNDESALDRDAELLGLHSWYSITPQSTAYAAGGYMLNHGTSAYPVIDSGSIVASSVRPGAEGRSIQVGFCQQFQAPRPTRRTRAGVPLDHGTRSRISSACRQSASSFCLTCERLARRRSAAAPSRSSSQPLARAIPERSPAPGPSCSAGGRGPGAEPLAAGPGRAPAVAPGTSAPADDARAAAARVAASTATMTWA